MKLKHYFNIKILNFYKKIKTFQYDFVYWHTFGNQTIVNF